MVTETSNFQLPDDEPCFVNQVSQFGPDAFSGFDEEPPRDDNQACHLILHPIVASC